MDDSSSWAASVLENEIISSTMKTALLGSYSLQFGPPVIKSHGWGQALLKEVDPHLYELLYPDAVPGRMHLWADFGNPGVVHGTASTLTARQAGREIGRSEVVLDDTHVPSIWLEESAIHGDQDIVVELQWGRGHQLGSRHLHVIPPRLARHLKYSGCLLSNELPPPAPSHAAVSTEIHRGFGVELELLTSMDSAVMSAGRSAVGGEVHVVQAAWRHACQSASSAEPAWLLDRLAHGWGVDEDKDVCTTTPSVVGRMLADAQSELLHVATSGGGFGETARGGSEPVMEPSVRQRLVQLLLGEPGAHKTEFRSPAPPKELSFGRPAKHAAGRGHGDGQTPSAEYTAAEEELRGFSRLLRASGAAAASTVAASCYSGTAVHVHINVRSPLAAGAPLSVRQILSVFLSWVRFDLVSARLARPWMWREPSCTPLYATGPEMVSGNGRDAAWNQGMRAMLPGGSASLTSMGADVPGFVSGAYALLRSAAFNTLPEVRQLETLFDDLATQMLGRFCSLNVLRVCSYGTLEVRRFHGTVDGGVVAHWAAFCVGFVEASKDDDRIMAAVLEPPSLAEGLLALQHMQESASMDELRALLDGHVHSSTIELLLAEARHSDLQAERVLPSSQAHTEGVQDNERPGEMESRASKCAVPSGPPAPSRTPVLPSLRRKKPSVGASAK